jgi:hypothetical protein
MGTTLLRNVVENLDAYSWDTVAYVPIGADIGADTPVELKPYEKSTPAPAGFEYFLEISIMKDVTGSHERENGGPLSLAQKVAALKYYAQNDAYLELDALRSVL